MYLYNGRTIRLSRAWTDDNGTQHPANWGRWSEEEKIARGLVWQDEPPVYDNKFYWSSGEQRDLDVLKQGAVDLCKQQAGSMLVKSDWYITRQAETGKAVPEDIANYRQAVRSASTTIETAITACTTLEEFMALYVHPVDEEQNQTWNAPINDWPVDPNAEVIL